MQFPEENFTLVIFHYDDSAKQWQELDWNRRAIHIQAVKQSKWSAYHAVPLKLYSVCLLGVSAG